MLYIPIFPAKSIFPPITIRSILYLSDINLTKEAEAGKDYFFDPGNIPIGTNDTLVLTQLYDPKNIFKIPLYNNQGIVNLKNELSSASNYIISHDNITVNEFSCNFDKRESMPEKLTKSEIARLFDNKYQIKPNIISPEEDFATSLVSLRTGRELWKYFLILAIIFLMAEFVISRFMIPLKTGRDKILK